MSHPPIQPRPTEKGARLPDHTERESHPWERNVAPHPPRAATGDYRRARRLTVEKANSIDGFFYGSDPYEDHHGGGLWLKDADGWFMVRNLAGIEWSAQFCADPAKVDKLRVNARRVYAGFPAAVEELGIRELLDTPITDDVGVARWTDSICNASVAMPRAVHTAVLPTGGGIHHYPAPVAEITLFKYDDFELWVKDEQGSPAAVAPLSRRGSGDGRVRVLYATPGTALAKELSAAPISKSPDLLSETVTTETVTTDDQGLILEPSNFLARQAFSKQVGPATPQAEPV